MTKPWKEWSWDELATEAQTGTRGQGAVVESSRRLTEAIQASGDCASTQTAQVISLTNVLKVLTWVLVALAVVQVVLMVWKG